MQLSSQQCGIGISETIAIHRRPELPSIELCCITGSNRRLSRFCTGLDVVVPQTWEGDILYRRRNHRLVPGMALCAEPGLVLRFVEVRRAGDLSILTVDSEVLIRLLVAHLPALGSPIQLSNAAGSLVSAWLAQLQNRNVSFDALLASLGGLVEQLSPGSAMSASKVEVEPSPSGSHPPEAPSRQHSGQSSFFERSALARFLESAPCRAQATSLSAMSLDHLGHLLPDKNLGLAEPGSRMSRRGFSARHGLPPHAYDLCRRIALAQQALRLGRTELTKVAMDYGFVDQSHFIRHFKRLVGVTPSRYRRCDTSISQVASEPQGGAAHKGDQIAGSSFTAASESGASPTVTRQPLIGGHDAK